MKLIFFYFFYSLYVLTNCTAYSQTNLVPNHGFEDLADMTVCGTSCPVNNLSDQIAYWDKIYNWTIPDKKNSFLCIPYSANNVSSPDCFCEPSNAHSGNNYGHLSGEYLTIQMSSKLKKTYLYYVEFYVLTSATDPNIGAYFSVDKQKQCEYELIDVTPQILTTTTNTGNWTKVTGTYSPTEQDEWILFGSFKESQTGFVLDDILVYELGPGPGECCPEYQLYQNTSNVQPTTHVQNYIKAGNNVGAPDGTGNVTIQSGQNITLKAGKNIELHAGFTVQAGATFTAAIQECNVFTSTTEGQYRSSFCA